MPLLPLWAFVACSRVNFTYLIHMTYYTFHVEGSCPILYSSVQAILNRATDVRCACVESYGTLTRVRPRTAHRRVHRAQVVAGSEYACSTGFLQARLCVRTSVDHFYARSQNGEKLAISFNHYCLSVRPPVRITTGPPMEGFL